MDMTVQVNTVIFSLQVFFFSEHVDSFLWWVIFWSWSLISQYNVTNPRWAFFVYPVLKLLQTLHVQQMLGASWDIMPIFSCSCHTVGLQILIGRLIGALRPHVRSGRAQPPPPPRDHSYHKSCLSLLPTHFCQDHSTQLLTETLVHHNHLSKFKEIVHVLLKIASIISKWKIQNQTELNWQPNATSTRTFHVTLT